MPTNCAATVDQSTLRLQGSIAAIKMAAENCGGKSSCRAQPSRRRRAEEVASAMASSSFSSSSSFFFFFFLLCSTVFLRVCSQEKDILLQMKEEWGNPPSLSSWSNLSSPCVDFSGVTCDGGAAVTEISLRSLEIEGQVPAAVCNLRTLSSLDLSDNYIGGEFPVSLYGCANLRQLNISDNLFVGGIPSDVDRLVGLEILDLSSNNFSGDVPPAIARIAGLRELHLDNNLFNGTFPPELGNLSKLEYLSIAVNPFAPAKLPPELGNLTKLRSLWASEANLFGEIPPELGKMTELEFLQISWNDLEGPIPGELWRLPKLKFVYLFHNHLSGEIAADGTIASVQLTEVDLSMNNFTGRIPLEFGRNPNLRLLFLYKNQLTGEIPDAIGSIPALEDLRLFENNLTGSIPPAMGNFSRLLNLELWSNGLSGELPDGLCAGGELDSLVLQENRFTGRLPLSLGNCRPLRTLRLSGNSFSGDFPSAIWSLKNLSTVILTGNKFSGELPATMPPTLSRLEIENNRFSGDVPLSAPALQVFRASYNSFSRKISPDLTGMDQLQEFLLDGNQISGEIPAGINALKSLTVLSLRSNRLAGEIPREIGSLPVLTSLDLSENQLSGELPPAMGNLKLNFLNLSGNHLSGRIPTALQNPAYATSFLSNDGLCSSTSFINLPPCGGKSEGSGNLSRVLVAVFLSLGLIIFLVTALLVFLVVRERYQKKKEDSLQDSWKLTSFQALQFSESHIVRGIVAGNLVGGGGSGEVYRVPVDNVGAVAVKRLHRNGKVNAKAEKEFDSEVKILSSIRHANIVKLLCCISGEEEKLLVYEFMENGSLDKWLHEERSPEMGWPARLSAAIGAARGLCYMHDDCSPAIIHRDIKSSNILLDSDFQGRVSDFGIARMLGNPSFATAVAGSAGYMAPEQAYGRRINEKVDVYSFGVVLLEITTGRRAADGGDGGGSLVDWAWRRFQDGGAAAEALDPRIVEEGNVEEMELVHRLGLACTAEMPAKRPAMREVLQLLLRCEHKRSERRKHDGDGDESPTPLLGNAAKANSRRKTQPSGVGEDEEGVAYSVQLL